MYRHSDTAFQNLLLSTTTRDLCRRLILILKESEADISHIEGLYTGKAVTDDVTEMVSILIEDRNQDELPPKTHTMRYRSLLILLLLRLGRSSLYARGLIASFDTGDEGHGLTVDFLTPRLRVRPTAIFTGLLLTTIAHRTTSRCKNSGMTGTPAGSTLGAGVQLQFVRIRDAGAATGFP